MRRLLTLLAALSLTAACNDTVDLPLVPETVTPASAPARGCTGCTDPSPIPRPEHGCLPPSCHIVRTKRASRSRSTPVQKPVDLGVRKYHVTCYDTGTTTASGKPVREGMVATAKKLHIPFGTKVTIDGFGTYTVEDRIGWGSDIDIYRDHCSLHFPTGDYRAVFHN